MREHAKRIGTALGLKVPEGGVWKIRIVGLEHTGAKPLPIAAYEDTRHTEALGNYLAAAKGVSGVRHELSIADGVATLTHRAPGGVLEELERFARTFKLPTTLQHERTKKREPE